VLATLFFLFAMSRLLVMLAAWVATDDSDGALPGQIVIERGAPRADPGPAGSGSPAGSPADNTAGGPVGNTAGSPADDTAGSTAGRGDGTRRVR